MTKFNIRDVLKFIIESSISAFDRCFWLIFSWHMRLFEEMWESFNLVLWTLNSLFPSTSHLVEKWQQFLSGLFSFAQTTKWTIIGNLTIHFNIGINNCCQNTRLLNPDAPVLNLSDIKIKRAKWDLCFIDDFRFPPSWNRNTTGFTNPLHTCYEPFNFGGKVAVKWALLYFQRFLLGW